MLRSLFLPLRLSPTLWLRLNLVVRTINTRQSHPHPAASGSPVGLSSWGTSIRPCRRWIAPLRVNTRSSLPFPFSSQYPPSGAADPAWHPPCRRLHCQLPSILPSNFASSPDPLSLHSTDDNWLHCQEHLNHMCSRVTISWNFFCFLDKYHTRVYDITVHVGRNGTSKRYTPLWIWQMGAYVWSNPISWFGNDFGLWSYLVCLMVFLVSVCFHCITTLSFGDFSIYFISFFILMVDHLFFFKVIPVKYILEPSIHMGSQKTQINLIPVCTARYRQQFLRPDVNHMEQRANLKVYIYTTTR